MNPFFTAQFQDICTRKLAKVGKIILQIIADEAFDDELLQKSNVDLASMASM
jgi:hypothetical protein